MKKKMTLQEKKEAAATRLREYREEYARVEKDFPSWGTSGGETVHLSLIHGSSKLTVHPAHHLDQVLEKFDLLEDLPNLAKFIKALTARYNYAVRRANACVASTDELLKFEEHKKN